MTDHDPHRVDPDDEGRHHPADLPYWNESVYLDFVADDGAIAGYARKTVAGHRRNVTAAHLADHIVIEVGDE